MGVLKKIWITLREQGRHPLNRKSKLRAAFDFSIAQVAARLIPGDVCVPFPNEQRLLVPPRMKGAAHFIYPGLCEFEDMAFVMHFLRPAELFLDIGANIGAYTVLAAGVAGCNVTAFEPSPASFRYLLANIRLNDLSQRVTPWNVALGAEGGTLYLTEGLGTENFVCESSGESNSTKVKVITLDSALDQANPMLLKIDVEGFETKVFAGAAQVLSKPTLRAMLVEKAGNGARYGFDEEALHGKIQQMSFVACSYSPFQRTLSRLSEKTGGNIIYVRDFEVAQQRLRNGAPFRFGGLSI